jgi:glutaminyl-peptide cyclotransferase
MKKTRIFAIVLIVLFVGIIVFRSFNTGVPKPNVHSDKPSVSNTVQSPPDFNADSAYHYLKTQVDFGPRVPNTTAHERCGDWLVNKLKSLGATVVEQKAIVTAFDGTPLKMRNIIASFQPEKKKRVMLAAHWDTRPFADKDPDKTKWKKPIDGANDGASGVAVLMEIARHLSMDTLDIGIDIAFWDAEDYGRPEWDETEDPEGYKTWCLGSQYWMKNKHAANYQAAFGILLDMVGAKDARFNREGFSMAVAEDVVNKVWSTAHSLGYQDLFQMPVTGEIVDDHYFMNQAGVRSIDIIDMRPSTRAMGFDGYEFGGFHHTHNDNMDIIDPATLRSVGRTLLQVVYNTK